ncbi:MAG TPA: hypothetical protein DDW95_12935, partial [Alphaproteobacteria bacterium]|nr:hypothetical protein [Alphaproteobacteria bacterium]
MDQTLGNFIKALRNSEVRVSSMEAVDAHHVVDLIGYRDRDMLKNSLALVLPKTPEEKAIYDYTFDRFFAFRKLDEQDPDQLDDTFSPENIVPSLSDEMGEGAMGEGGGGGGQGCSAQGGGEGEGIPDIT